MPKYDIKLRKVYNIILLNANSKVGMEPPVLNKKFIK